MKYATSKALFVGDEALFMKSDNTFGKKQTRKPRKRFKQKLVHLFQAVAVSQRFFYLFTNAAMLVPLGHCAVTSCLLKFLGAV